MDSPSTKKNFELFRKKLLEYGVSREVSNAFLKDEEIVEKIIPSGAKGWIRGAEFNRIVKDFILAFSFLEKNRFEIAFEKTHIVGKKVSGKLSITTWNVCTILAPWFKMQGPNGILAKLLQLGLEYPDGNKITILSAEEYTSQILGSCTIC